MRIFFGLMVAAIASALVVQTFFGIVRPEFSRWTEGDRFLALSWMCNNSKTWGNSTPSQGELLSSGTVEANLVCAHWSEMRLRFLSLGVGEPNVLALEAKAAIATPSQIRQIFLEDSEGWEKVFDTLLRTVIRDVPMRQLETKPFEETEKFKLGRALFFDPILSGNRDIACATCHLPSFGTSDGLSVSIGTQAADEMNGVREERAAQPRNALDLWNRDHDSVTSMRWDGGVEVLEPNAASFRSPLGESLPDGFENLMAVQSVFPLVRVDEMLGMPGDTSNSELAPPHAGLVNEIADGLVGLEGTQRVTAAHQLVGLRLLGNSDEADNFWQLEFRRLFVGAYPDLEVSAMGIQQIGNALANFIEISFSTRETPWDQYISGNETALTGQAKRGGYLFFGPGRCAECHTGQIFSDFLFHAIGVPNHGPGFGGNGDDLGRFLITGKEDDL